MDYPIPILLVSEIGLHQVISLDSCVSGDLWFSDFWPRPTSSGGSGQMQDPVLHSFPETDYHLPPVAELVEKSTKKRDFFEFATDGRYHD